MGGEGGRETESVNSPLELAQASSASKHFSCEEKDWARWYQVPCGQYSSMVWADPSRHQKDDTTK